MNDVFGRIPVQFANKIIFIYLVGEGGPSIQF